MTNNISFQGPLKSLVEIDPSLSKETKAEEKTITAFEGFKTSLSIHIDKISWSARNAGSSLVYSRMRKAVFQHKILAETVNFGKKEDIELYQKFQGLPIKLSDTGKSLTRLTGGIKSTEMKLSPIFASGGKCNGAVAFFLYDFLTNHDIKTLAKKYEGGVPLEGVICQEIHSQLCANRENRLKDSMFFLEVTSVYGDMLNRPQHESWNPGIGAGFEEEVKFVFEGLHACLYKDEFQQKKANPKAKLTLADDVKKWVYEKYGDKVQNTKVLEEALMDIHLIEAKAKYEGYLKILSDDVDLAFSGLSIDKVLVDDRGPGTCLREIANLEPGAYKLSYPVDDSGGHTIAFILEPNGKAYFYDPNLAVAEIEKGGLYETCKRFFKEEFKYEPETEKGISASHLRGKERNKNFYLYKIQLRDPLKM